MIEGRETQIKRKQRAGRRVEGDGEERGETGRRVGKGRGGGRGFSGVSYLLVWFMSEPLLANSALTNSALTRRDFGISELPIPG